MTPEKKVQNQIVNYLNELQTNGFPVFVERRNAGGFSYKKGIPDLYASVNGLHIEIEVKPNDVVVILFMDRNFIQNLKQIKGNQKLTSLQQNIDLHSDKFGIIIGTL